MCGRVEFGIPNSDILMLWEKRAHRLNQTLFTVMVIAFAVGSFERHIFQGRIIDVCVLLI